MAGCVFFTSNVATLYAFRAIASTIHRVLASDLARVTESSFNERGAVSISVSIFSVFVSHRTRTKVRGEGEGLNAGHFFVMRRTEGAGTSALLHFFRAQI